MSEGIEGGFPDQEHMHQFAVVRHQGRGALKARVVQVEIENPRARRGAHGGGDGKGTP